MIFNFFDDFSTFFGKIAVKYFFAAKFSSDTTTSCTIAKTCYNLHFSKKSKISFILR